MKKYIRDLEEAIAGAIQPIGAPQRSIDYDGQDSSEGQGDIQEVAVSLTSLDKFVTAMAEAPKVKALVDKMLAQSGASPEGQEAFTRSLKGHLRHSVPLAMQDAGLDVQTSLAGKARRGIKLIAKGKGIGEAMEVWEQDLEEFNGDLYSDVSGMLVQED